METFSALLAICAGNSPVTGEFPTQRPVTRSFDVFLGLRLNKRLGKQSRGWWFETPWRPLWRHCNGWWNLAKNDSLVLSSYPWWAKTLAPSCAKYCIRYDEGSEQDCGNSIVNALDWPQLYTSLTSWNYHSLALNHRGLRVCFAYCGVWARPRELTGQPALTAAFLCSLMIPGPHSYQRTDKWPPRNLLHSPVENRSCPESTHYCDRCVIPYG